MALPDWQRNTLCKYMQKNQDSGAISDIRDVVILTAQARLLIH